MSLISFFDKLFLTFRECFISDPSKELQEETLADLHHCLDQLQDRLLDIDEKIQISIQRALLHFKLSKQSSSTFESSREKQKSKQFLQDKRRLQYEHDQITKNILLLQQQIDTIISSQLNMSVIGAMKLYNMNAVKLSLPAQTYDLETLEEQLSERAGEVSSMMQAMNRLGTAVSSTTFHDNEDNFNINVDDSELFLELESLLDEQKNPQSLSVLQDPHIPSTSDVLMKNSSISFPSTSTTESTGIISDTNCGTHDIKNAMESATLLTDNEKRKMLIPS
jgi:hypothetical protein